MLFTIHYIILFLFSSTMQHSFWFNTYNGELTTCSSYKKYIVWTVHFSSSFEISIDRTLLHLRDFSMTMYHAARHRSFSLHMLVCLFLYPWPLFQYPLNCWMQWQVNGLGTGSKQMHWMAKQLNSWRKFLNG